MGKQESGSDELKELGPDGNEPGMVQEQQNQKSQTEI